jgi:hypothetical protein
LSEALPIYSGGLGNVAGDQLKAASDLGVPVIGVGLLYSQGYFRQFIDRDGAQQAVFPYNDPGQLPITPLRRPNGEWLRLILDLSGRAVWLRAWQVRVGRLALYLLDSNDAANAPMARIAGARPAESGRFRSGLQHGVSGDPRERGVERRSRLHADVSRHLFAPLFARWPIDEVPVGYVTNGVHMPTWDSAAADELWTDACGKGTLAGHHGGFGTAHSRCTGRATVAIAQRRSQVSRGIRARPIVPTAGGVRSFPRVGRCRQPRVRSRRVDAWLRAALCHVQKAQPAFARSRTAAAAVERPRAADATRACRQGASGGHARARR